MPASQRGLDAPPSTPRRADEGGVTITELVVAVGVAAVLASTAIATVGGSREAISAAGAARYLAGRIQQVRAMSLTRGVHVALVFRTVGSDYCYATVVDGNRNGVRTAEISGGTDRQVEPCERLSDHFEGVTFGIGTGVTDPDSATLLSGSPLRLGGSTVLSYGPDGASTSGTVYLRSRSGLQYAVRILGTTGRSRVLRFDVHSLRWESP
jgi:hypothetical protein